MRDMSVMHWPREVWMTEERLGEAPISRFLGSPCTVTEQPQASCGSKPR